MNSSRTISLNACQRKKEKENATLKMQRNKRCIQTNTLVWERGYNAVYFEPKRH